MKHWDGRDRPLAATPIRLPERDRQRIRAMFLEQPKLRRRPLQLHSLVGLAISIGVLVGLAYLLSPSDPVSSKILN